MKKTAVLLTLLLLLAALSACQPTPEADTVHQKGAENEQKWMEPAPIEEGKQRMEVPERWEEKLDIREDLKVEIEAGITVPNTTVFPIYALESAAFDREKLDSVVEKLLPNARFQCKPEKKSKEELEYEIEVEKNAIEKVDQEHPNFTPAERKEYLAEAQAHLQSLMEEYNHLDTASDPVNVEYISDYLGKDWYTAIEAFDPASDRRIGTIELNTAPEKENDNTTMKLILLLNKGFVIDGESIKPDTKNEAEVREAVNRILQYTELEEEYVIDRIYWDEDFYRNTAFVVCTRQIGEARETFVNGCSSLKEIDETLTYAPSVGLDSIAIRFFPEGDAQFIWDSPKKMLKLENENAKLLSFDEIQEKARKAFSYIASPSGSVDDVLYYRIVINDIRLGYMTVKRAGGGYSTIPVWDFFGYYYKGFSSQDATSLRLDENGEHRYNSHGGTTSMLTLNAMDGSIIDRSTGY